MKKLGSLFLVMLFGCFCISARKVTIKAGTIIPLQSVNQVKAADVLEGQLVDFRVMQDVCVDNAVVIPRGTCVKGKVVEAKKSSVAGTKGRLGITITTMNLPSGDPLFLTNTEVHISGNNRTVLAVATGIFLWPCFLIPGTKAVMPAGYEVQANVAAHTTAEVD